ncbi:MAG: outer membrane protein transport protein [Deltaproteobacteria bacterium]|nr:outer membrane protein transport protein [Deltaproteobacteria bacterium]
MFFFQKPIWAMMAAVLLFLPAVARATNGYYLIGTGAKSLGMAGAVVANPQGALCMLRNPAAIACLAETTADVGGAVFMPTRHMNGYKSDSNLYMIPSAALVFNPKDYKGHKSNFAFGIGTHFVSGMGVDWDNNNLTGGMLQKVYSRMAMMEMGVGGGYRVNNSLAIGFTPVFTYEMLEIEYGWKGGAKDALDQAYAAGGGFDVGIVYQVNDKLKLGLAYKSKRWMENLSWNVNPDGKGSCTMLINPNAEKVKMRLDMPRQIAFGINIQPFKPLNIEMDVRWINYHNVMNEVPITGMINPMTGQPAETWNFHWRNQWVFALGTAYRPSDRLTLRAGFNYGKSPVEDKDLNANIISMAIMEAHLTANISYKISKNLEFSLAYVHGFKHKQTYQNTSPQEICGYGNKTEIKMYQNMVALQLNLWF